MLRKVILSVSSGALLCLAFPKWNLGPLAWIAFVPLLFAIEGAGFKKAFFYGWLAGFTAFCGILYWILPTFRAAGVSVWVGVLGLFLLASYVALYFGVFTGVSRKFFSRFGAGIPLLFAVAFWVALEWWRGWFLSGFPWELLGYSQWKMPALIQISEWTGVYGVSAMVLLGNFCAFHLLKKRLRPAVFAAVPLSLLLSANVFLKTRFEDHAEDSAAIGVSVLQGNIDQYKKWSKEYVEDILNVYGSLAQSASKTIAGAPETNLVVWPETATPGWIPDDQDLMRWISNTVKKTGAYHLLGAVTRESGTNTNAAFLFSPEGIVLARYDKMHLVPFGEFVPFQNLLGAWIPVLNELGGFEPGSSLKLLDLKGTKLGTSICYEMIFPELIRRQAAAGAGILVNLTNDGWYLDTAAPEQHFSMNVLRAVENRRTVVRAANTGISGVILPDGRVESKTRLLERAVHSAAVHPSRMLTFYSRFGNIFVWICCVWSALGILLSLKGAKP